MFILRVIQKYAQKAIECVVWQQVEGAKMYAFTFGLAEDTLNIADGLSFETKPRYCQTPFQDK
jgi:hypothetical protein